jgi:transketolase
VSAFEEDQGCLVLPHAFPSCALQYILLHLLGYKLSMDDLKSFRQLDSVTPGHPEAGHTDGVLFLAIP